MADDEFDADTFARYSSIAETIAADIGQISIDGHGFGSDARYYAEGLIRFLRFAGAAGRFLTASESYIIQADRADSAAVCRIRTINRYPVPVSETRDQIREERRTHYAPTAHGALGGVLQDLHRWAMIQIEDASEGEIDERAATALYEHDAPGICEPLNQILLLSPESLIARMQRERVLLLSRFDDADRAEWSSAEVAGEFARRLDIDRKTFQRYFDDGMYPGSVAEQKGQKTQYRIRLDRLDAATRGKISPTK